MATYVNNLRLMEIATGAESGTWGTKTNTNLELIADAFGSGTEAITTNADTHTTTIADGAADEGRAIYMKYTGTLDSACTITLAPNTVNKFWIIENATSGSQNIVISQGSGANITIGNGNVAAIFTDGAGSGAAVLDAFADLELSSTLTVAGNVDFNGALDVDGTTNLDAVDIDGAVQIDSTVTVGVDDTGYDVKFFGDTASAYMLWDTSTDDLVLAGAAGIDLAGDLDVDGTTNLDAVDIDGAVQVDSTITVGADDQGYDVKFFGDTASAYMLWDTSADDLVLAGAAGIDLAGDIDVDGTANLDIVDIDGAVDMASTLTLAGNADFNGDLDVDGTTNLDVVDIDGAVDMASTLALASHLDMPDSAKILLGTGDDLELYHNGSNSYIGEAGTGDLYIYGESNIYLANNSTGSENYLAATKDGAVTLYHDNSAKVSTSSSGLSVTGGVVQANGSTDADILNSVTNSATSLMFGVSDSSANRFVGSANNYAFWGTTSAHGLEFATNNTVRFTIDSAGDVKVVGGYLSLAATERLYLDGGSNTYIYESSADIIRFYCGGTENISLQNDDILMPDGGKIYWDGGVDTYTTLISNNVIGWYCGNTEAMRLTDGTCTITGDIKIPATKKLYLDGGSDTYIVESSSNTMDLYTSNLAVRIDGNQNLTVHGPSITIGDGTAEDTKLVFDGNAQDFHIGLDDTDDDLKIGVGSSLGTTPVISIQHGGDVAIGSDNFAGYKLSVYNDDDTITMNVGSSLSANQDWNGIGFGHISQPKAGIFFERQASNSVGRLNFCITNSADSTDVVNSDRAFSVNSDKTLDIAYDIKLDATKKLYLDGGGNTYIHEPSGDIVEVVTGGTASARFHATSLEMQGTRNLIVQNGGKVYLDGGSDVYMEQGTTDRFDVVAGGVTGFHVAESGGAIAVKSYGSFECTGALSKGSGTFKIDHPIKPETHDLVHSFVEGPRADLIYRGVVSLSDGWAEVDLDEVVGLTEGTWAALCRDPQVWVQNDSGWDAVKGSVSGSTLTIVCQAPNSYDEVSWLVVAERQDDHICEADWTDSEGRPILEPEKVDG